MIPFSGELSDLKKVAELIAGDDPPSWLALHLMDWCYSLNIHIGVFEIQPSRSEMRERLNEVRRCALSLVGALKHAPTLEFLELGPLGRIERTVKLGQELLDLAACAEKAANFPELAKEGGKTRAGRGRAKPLAAISPEVYCAAIVAETWAFFRGAHPLPRNRKAAEAAEIYWVASGAPSRKGWGDDPLVRWRRRWRPQTIERRFDAIFNLWRKTRQISLLVRTLPVINRPGKTLI